MGSGRLPAEHLRFFALGVVAAAASTKFVKSKTFHEGCVNVVAGGMRLKRDATASFEKVKEDAQDIVFDATKASEEVKA